MPAKIALPLLWLTAGCATIEPAQVLEFECGDVAVVGQIRTLDQKALQGTGPLPDWQNAYQLEVQVKRVLRGSESRPIIPVTGTAHARIRADRDFLMVLRPDGAGGYSLSAASLWRYRPRLSTSCPGDRRLPGSDAASMIPGDMMPPLRTIRSG